LGRDEQQVQAVHLSLPTTAKPAAPSCSHLLHATPLNAPAPLPNTPTPPAAEAAARQHSELAEAHQSLENEYLSLVAQTQDDRRANRACLQLARSLTTTFGSGWRLLSPQGATMQPPAEWRAVAASNTRHLA
jgi:hypothetical protein